MWEMKSWGLIVSNSVIANSRIVFYKGYRRKTSMICSKYWRTMSWLTFYASSRYLKQSTVTNNSSFLKVNLMIWSNSLSSYSDLLGPWLDFLICIDLFIEKEVKLSIDSKSWLLNLLNFFFFFLCKSSNCLSIFILS